MESRGESDQDKLGKSDPHILVKHECFEFQIKCKVCAHVIFTVSSLCCWYFSAKINSEQIKKVNSTEAFSSSGDIIIYL